MSDSTDEKIVSMKFNNGEFESGVSDTLNSLDKLKTGLNEVGADKSLNSLDTSKLDENLQNVADNTDKMSRSFSSMGMVGNLVFYNLGYSALQAGENILKGMTVTPIIQGFEQYSSKMQTLMELQTALGQGADGAITKSMNTLNVYAEKTVYNVADMNSALGQMVSQGININDATTAIIGFGNAAASAGVSTSTYSSEISTALVPALALGKLQGQNWLQLKQSGIATAAFQQALIKSANAQGLNIKNTAQFNAALMAGTINTNIMIGALKSLATNSALLGDAMNFHTWSEVWGAFTSGMVTDWSDFWESILGDANKATPLFTNLGNALTGMEGTFDTVLVNIGKNFNKFGGMTASIDAVKYGWRDFMEVIKPVGAAIEAIFPTNLGTQWANMATAAANFFYSFKVGTAASQELEGTFKGLFAIFDLIGQVLGGVGTLFGVVFKALDPAASAALKLSGNWGDMLANFDKTVKSGGYITTFFTSFGNLIALPIQLLETFTGNLKDSANEVVSWGKSWNGIDFSAVDTAFGRVADRFKSLNPVLTAFGDIWDWFAGIFKAAWVWMQPGLDAIGQAFEGLGTAISNSFKSGNFSAVIDVLNTGLFAMITLAVRNFFKNGLKVNIGGGFLDSIGEAFEGLTSTLSAMQSKLKAETLQKIAVAVGILTVSVVALSLINSERLTAASAAITVMVGQLAAALAVLSKISVGLSSSAKITILAIDLTILGAAIDILTGAVLALSHLSWDQLAKGMSALTIMLTELVGVTKLMGNSANILGAAVGLTALAGAVAILAGAIAVMGTMSWESIGKGMLGVAGGITIMVAAMNFIPKNPLVVASAAALLIMATAMVTLGGALKIMGSMSWDSIAKSLVELGGALTILVTALTVLSDPIVLIGAAAMAVVSVSLSGLAAALVIMGNMSWSDIGKSMVALAGSLLILSVAMIAMIPALPGAAALVVVAAGLAVFVPILAALGVLPWATVVQGLEVLALSLTVVGIAGIALIPAIPGLLGLGGAIVLLGGGLLLAGVGLAAFAGGLATITALGPAAAAAMTAMLTAVVDMIPAAATALAVGVGNFLTTLAGESGAVLAAAITLLDNILKASNTESPKIISTLLNLAGEMISAISSRAPSWETEGIYLVIKLLNGLSSRMGSLTQAGANVIIAFINGLSTQGTRITNAGIQAAVNFINGVAGAIRSHQGEMNAAGLNLAGAIADGMTGGLASKVAGVAQSAYNLGKKAISAIANAVNSNSPSKEAYKIGSYVGDGFSGGMDDSQAQAAQSANDLGNTALSSLQNTMAGLNTAMYLDKNLQPTVTPVLDLTQVKQGAQQINGLVQPNPLSVKANYATASGIAATAAANTQTTITPNGETVSNNGGITFVQNNTSPVALSTADIYRQTNNGISKLKTILKG